MKIRIKILSFTIALLIVSFLTGCNQDGAQPHRKAWHADDMLFANNIGIIMLTEFGGIFSESSYPHPELIFAHSREAAEQFAEFIVNEGNNPEIIIAWPSVATELMLEWLNGQLPEMDIDLSDFSLSHPITVVDTVVNWEEVHRLMGHLPREFPDGEWLDLMRNSLRHTPEYLEEQNYFFDRWAPGVRERYSN